MPWWTCTVPSRRSKEDQLPRPTKTKAVGELMRIFGAANLCETGLDTPLRSRSSSNVAGQDRDGALSTNQMFSEYVDALRRRLDAREVPHLAEEIAELQPHPPLHLFAPGVTHRVLISAGVTERTAKEVERAFRDPPRPCFSFTTPRREFRLRCIGTSPPGVREATGIASATVTRSRTRSGRVGAAGSTRTP